MYNFTFFLQSSNDLIFEFIAKNLSLNSERVSIEGEKIIGKIEALGILWQEKIRHK